MPKSDFTGDQNQAVYRMLRRLQQHNQSDITAMIAERSMSSFTLQEEDTPIEADDRVVVAVYPQNPFIGEPEIRRMSVHDIKTGLVNSRVRIQDDRGELAQPDDDGNYIFPVDTPQFEQVNAFFYTTFTLRMYERYARRAIPWAFPGARITVDVHVGDDANAFYNENARMLGFHSFTGSDGVQRSTAISADIVTHEAAHAVLDGLRDLWNESFGLGPRAFHEAFGDITAMLVALYDSSLVRRVIEWTKGDLRMSNFISEVAEHLTMELNSQADENPERTVYLRNALNTLIDMPFDSLTYNPSDPETTLGRQEHNYSRLFTGAIYDLLVAIYDHKREKSQPFVALIQARDVMGKMLVSAIELGPVGEFDFSDMARAFVAADEIRCGGCYYDKMVAIFDERGILSRSDAEAFRSALRALPDIRLPKSITNALAASLFLEKEVLPKLDLQIDHELLPMATYRNADGYVYMTFFSPETITLEGAEFGAFSGVKIDVFGGLSLMFTPEDRLCSVIYRPVIAEDVRQIRVIVREMIELGRITDNLHPFDNMPEPAPKGLLIQSLLPDDAGVIVKRLVQYPTIVDQLPEQLSGLVTYLKKQMNRT